MRKEVKSALIKYGCCAAFVLLLGGMYLSGGEFAISDLQNKFRLLCDAFSVPGILLILFGALIWASNEGALDGISYCLTILGRSLIPGGRSKKDERYADYVERKRNNRTKGYSFLFSAGGVSLVIGLVFLALFYFV